MTRAKSKMAEKMSKLSNMPKMPKVDLEQLSGDSLDVAKQITKKDGTLYSSKPKKANGLAKFIWRMVVFMVSSDPKHQCRPCTADFDLMDWIEETYPNVEKYGSREGAYTVFDKMREEDFKVWLRKIEDDIRNTIPRDQWHGAKRWAKAFGVI